MKIYDAVLLGLTCLKLIKGVVWFDWMVGLGMWKFGQGLRIFVLTIFFLLNIDAK
jgi:hypothetical protein